MIQCFPVAFLFSVSCVDSLHLHGWCVWQESLKTEQHVKALLRVILVACQASPASFAQGLVHIYFLLAISSCVWVPKLIFENLWSANAEGHELPAQNKMAMKWYEQVDSAVIKSHLIYLKQERVLCTYHSRLDLMHDMMTSVSVFSPPEMMPRLLFGLVLTEELNEEVLVGAMRCLVVLSAHLPKTSDIVAQIRNLLLHLFQKPSGQCYHLLWSGFHFYIPSQFDASMWAFITPHSCIFSLQWISGDYIWYLAITCGESIAMHLCPIPSVPGFGPISPGDTTMASTRTEGFPTPDIILKCNNNQDNLVSSRLLKRVIPLKGLLFRFHAFLASRPAWAVI